MSCHDLPLSNGVPTPILKPFTESGREEAVEVLKELDRVFKSQTNEEKVINNLGGLAGLLGETKDDKSINEALEGTGYSVSINPASGSIKDGTNQPYSYNVLKDGETVKSKQNVAQLTEFMTKDLGEDAYDIITKQAYEVTSDYLEERARQVAKEKKVIQSDKSLNLKYFENRFKDDIITGIKLSNTDLTEDEINEIEEVFRQEAAGTYEFSGEVDAKPKKVNRSLDERVEAYFGDQGILSNISKKLELKIQELGGMQFVKETYIEGVENFKLEELYNRSKTIGEKIMDSSGNQNLIRIGQGIFRTNENEFLENFKAKKKALPEIYEKNLTSVLNTQLKEIGKEAPADTKISVDYTPSGEAIFSVTNDRNLNTEEGKQLEVVQSKMFKLQQDYANLNTDYLATVDNMKRDFTDFYAANPVDSEVFRTSMKEYGLPELVAKDINDAFAGLALSVPTLFNSEWAVEEQKRLNAKNNYYETMGTYDDGDPLTYAFRTLGQQSGNITLAIATGGIGSAAGLSSAMTANAIGGLFGLSSGTQTYRDLKSQQQIVGTADKQAKIALNAYEKGFIDLYTYTNAMRDINKAKAMYEISDDQIVGASLANGIIEGTITRYLGTEQNTIKLFKDFKSPKFLKIPSSTLSATS